jgi:quercetin 2,3-dioxygenase
VSPRSRPISRRSALGASLVLPAGLLGCHRGEDRSSAQPAVKGHSDAGKASSSGDARILRVVPAVQSREGQGATVGRLFPTVHLKDLDPFVLLDDFNVQEPAGFPRHPHRGFEAFTYMLEGAFHHKDSLGNDSVVGAGGTQRFTSGRGAYHSEMPATSSDNRGLQLWVNLPRRLKTMDPSYGATSDVEVPEHDDAGAYVRQVVGGASPARLETAVDYVDLSLERAARFFRTIPAGHNAIIYVIAGAVRLMNRVLNQGQAALPTSGNVEIHALEFSRVLYLSGLPHQEPIVHHGPFVD